MRRKLDLTPHELLELREQGMTNKQIAAALDISVNTVLRYIGAQGVRSKSNQGDGVSKLAPVKKLPEAMVLRKILAINGFEFDIFPVEGKLQVWANGNNYHDLLFSAEQIDDLISALDAVKTQFGKKEN